MIADPRAEVAGAALGLLAAGGTPDVEAVRAAWEAPGPQAHPEPPAAPVRAGSVPLSPAEPGGGRVAARYAWSDRVIGALERVKAARGVPYEQKIERSDPARYARWAPPPCLYPGCDRGMVYADEDERVVTPCPSCRIPRPGGTA